MLFFLPPSLPHQSSVFERMMLLLHTKAFLVLQHCTYSITLHYVFMYINHLLGQRQISFMHFNFVWNYVFIFPFQKGTKVAGPFKWLSTWHIFPFWKRSVYLIPDFQHISQLKLTPRSLKKKVIKTDCIETTLICVKSFLRHRLRI